MDIGSQPARGADGLPDSVELDEQSGHLIRRAHQRACSILLSEMEDEQLTPAQSFALARLYEKGRLSQNHLGRLAAMDPATIQGVVRRLCDRGLIVRVPDPADRRRINLSLTGAGDGLARRLIKRVARADRAFLRPLSRQERELFLGLLRRLV